jgi:hypothetical protein
MPSNAPSKTRRSERESTTISISLVKRSDSFRQDDSAQTIDVSVNGMKVRTALLLAPKDWVGVIAKDEFPHAIPAQVVWARVDEHTLWTFAGIEFVSDMPA